MATRFYFPADTVADVNPAPGAWNYITEAVYRYLAKTKGTSPITIGTRVGPWTATAGQKALDRVYVSDPLSPQTISGTVKMQLMVREYATTDNVDRLMLLIKVVSGSGSTVRGTLLALGNYASTAEFISNATHRNKKGADGDALTSVVCQEHDRIVVEIGYCNSTAGTTPEASAKWGEDATDLPENETQTTNGAGWIQFSGDIVFSSEPNLDKQVAATGDDGYRYVNSYAPWSTSAATAYLGYSDDLMKKHCHGFARWIGVTYEGTVNVSYIECSANAAGVGTPELKVYGVDEDNPPAPTSAAEFDADPLTTNAVDWDGAWTADLWEQSPSLNDIFQELVNSYTISNAAVMVQIKNDHGVTTQEYNITRYYDYAGNLHGPKLHIEYTVGGAAYSIVAGAGSYALAGTATSLLADRVIGPDAGAYVLSGMATSLLADRVVGAGAGSYALTGAAVDLLKDMLISAAAGSYALTGQDAALLADRVITADPGAYALAGTAADFLRDMLISAGAGSYTIVGQDVSLLGDRVIVADSGIYIVTGAAVDFIRDLLLAAQAGNYVITGSDVALLRDLIMAATGGSYALTGSDVAFLYGKVMVAEGGSYAITGSQAGLLADLVMQALGGSYVITGEAASLLFGGIPPAPLERCIVQWRHSWEVSESGREEDG